MLSLARLLAFSLAAHAAVAQQIWGTYTTTWDQKQLFEYEGFTNPINFTKDTPSGQATITVSDTKTYQTIDGFGATLTDTAALTLTKLKSSNTTGYWELMHQLFNADISAHDAGLSFLRVSLGASDLSPAHYSLNDVSGDVAMAHFSLDKAANSIQVLKDVVSINKRIQLYLVPWSPPAWMKTNQKIGGGTISNKHYATFATYLYKSVHQLQSAVGVQPYAVAIQNEPQNADQTYPTCEMSVDAMGAIATHLRTLLNQGGLNSTKVIGYEHNWNDASSYPTELMSKYGSALDGVGFHCYAGSYKQQAQFTSVHPDKSIYMTECTGMIGTDFWTDIKWNMDNLFIGSVEYGARTALLWNLAADDKGGPLLPGSDSCHPGGCRPVVTVKNGAYTLNQEFFALAHAQRAVLPKDADGPLAKRAEVAVSGGDSWALRVGGYVTGRSNAGDHERYSLVVMNWDDSSNGNSKSQPLKTTISFRGMHVTYKFPVGLTTLSWYASPTGKARRGEVEVSHQGIDALPVEANTSVRATKKFAGHVKRHQVARSGRSRLPHSN